MTGAPQIRVSYLRSDLDALAHLAPEVERRVRARLGDVIAAADAELGIAWLPVEHDVRLTEAVADEVGAAGVRSWAKQGVLRAIETPLLGPIRTALARMGLEPHAALRRVPIGWPLVFRGCCDVEYERVGETRAELRLASVAPALFVEVYLEGIGAAFEGLIEAAGGREGAVTVALDETSRAAVYTCSWAARG